MNLRFSAAFAVLGCVALASCYPYDESKNKQQPGKPPQNQKTLTSAEQQKLQEQRDKLKAEEELKKKNDPLVEKPVEPSVPTGGDTTTEPTKPPVEGKRPEYAFASKVPGKEGFVFSPYNNKIVDVRDIPSGTLVSDPTYPESAKKYFRVP